MPNLPRRAVDGLLAFATGLAALGGTAAHAQADPFALPKTATAATVGDIAQSGPGLSEIEVDGRVLKRLVDLRGAAGALTIDADNARVAGLPVPDGVTGPVRLDTLKLYQWRFDQLRQRLVVRLLRKSDGANLRDFAAYEDEQAQRRTIAALRVDYDLNFSAGRGGTHGGGLVSGAFVKGDLAVVSSALVASGGAGKPPSARRLDSFVQVRLAGGGTVATAGDFISAGTSSQRPVRMGGLQIVSDFGHRPDMVTSPMPAFTGSVAVPTSLDILAGDQSYKLGTLEPGEFTVRNIPINPGRGSMAVLLRDPLGREVVQTVSFYQSNILLRPGLASYAMNAGFVRRRYAGDGDSYGPFAASAYYRRGLSPFLTLESSAETTPRLLNLGARADFTIGNVALSSLELRSSRDTAVGSGFMLNASIESVGQSFSGRAGVSLPTPRYSDVASRLGDAPPRTQMFANIGFDLARSIPFQLSYVRQEAARSPRTTRDAVRNELLTTNLFYSPTSRLNFSLSGGMRSAEARTLFVSAGVTLRFGARQTASALVSQGDGQTLTALGYQFNDHANSGLRAQASIGTLNGDPRVTAGAIHEGRWTTLNAGLQAASGQVSGQLSTTGSLIVTGGTIYARGQSANGYALVRAGDVAGVPIKLENRLIGKTDRRGRLLVQNLRPMVTQHIDVDGTKLPADAVVLTSRHVVSVPTRAIGLVEIDAVYFRPVYVKVIDPSGAALAAGLPAMAMPSRRETLIGFDGLLEFNTASGDRALIIQAATGRCRVEIPAKIANDASLSCHPLVEVTDAAAPGPARRKVARRN